MAETTIPNSGETGPIPDIRDADGKILGKFKDESALVEAYQELEKRLGESPPAPAETDETPPDAEPGSKPDLSIPQDPEPTEPVNLFEAAADEFASDSKISDKTYEALAKAGVTKQYVDQFIAGREALAERQQAESYELAGGQEQAEKMIEWAKTNLTPEQQATYNASVNGTDFNVAKQAIGWLVGLWRQSGMATVPGMPDGKPGVGPSGGFQSNEQVRAAMRDPRYQSDPAFREEVMKKMAASSNL